MEEAEDLNDSIHPEVEQEATMARSFTTVLALIVVVSTGCANSQGFNSPAMRAALHADSAAEPDGQPIANYDSRPSPPFRLGVFFANREFPSRQSIQKVEWLSTDRDQLLHEFASLQDERILTDTVGLMDATLRSEDVSGIREAGARHGADVVLVVDGAAAIDRYNNRYAWLYPTLIGAYLAPGTESDALVMITGSLWAIHSSWQAPIQTVEGVSKLIGSAVLAEDNAALKEAKELAIHALGMRIVDQLRLLAEELPHAKPNSR